jgi:UDP-2,4-diacetamido-2,4,6-trideoxy-beta-L-altropyranose hydrolase
LKPEILIRTDGNMQIGLGHIVRCSALAHMLKNDFQITFYCRELPLATYNELVLNEFNCKIIKNENEFFNQLDRNTIAVLDGYKFDMEYQKRIKTSCAKLVYIDDLHNQEYVADLIINHSPGIKPEDYHVHPYTKFALGLEYALLRPSFLEQAHKQRKIEKIENILICFGGSDYKNHTKSTLEVVLKFDELNKIIVITGAACKISNDLKQLLTSDKRIDHRHTLNENQMISAMLEAELAILPASGIIFEALSAKCLVLTAPVVENQTDLFKGFVELNSVISLEKFTKENLVLQLKYLLNNPLPVLSNPLKGESQANFQKIFSRLYPTLRNATIEDAKLLFEWANDATVRKNAFNTDPINWDDHLSWLERKINSHHCIIFILTLDSDNIGQIRFDNSPDDYWHIDYSIAEQYRGKGYGKIIVELGLDRIQRDIKNFKAKVKLNNIPSCKVFESLGFKVESVNESNNSHIEFVKTF